MSDNLKISKIIQQSCEEIGQTAHEKEKKGAKPVEIIHTAVTAFFEKLNHSGYGLDVNDIIDEWVEKKSQQCLDVAQESLKSFKESNSTIQSITETHTIEIEKITEDHREIDIQIFRDRFSAFQQDLLLELQNANKIIRQLEKEVEQLQKQSNIDPLTKLFNRKALEIDANDFLKFSDEKKLDLVAMMIDADDFKLINDTYGHVAGDKVLILLAKLFKSSIRDSDKAYRYGGEEFLILFSRAKLKDVVRIADRIMKTVRNNKIIYKNRTIRMTLSIGLTEHQKGDTLESLVERADAAVYEAKKAGKDKLVIG
ncbi:MAG: GGDEF domain-containing protein [Epsilonproteobacteria bacterium]|nr:GGDEF domain-containing protein [Campylobacterota bacterium]